MKTKKKDGGCIWKKLFCRRYNRHNFGSIVVILNQFIQLQRSSCTGLLAATILPTTLKNKRKIVVDSFTFSTICSNFNCSHISYICHYLIIKADSKRIVL